MEMCIDMGAEICIGPGASDLGAGTRDQGPRITDQELCTREQGSGIRDKG